MYRESDAYKTQEFEKETPLFEVDANMLELLSLTERGAPDTWGSTPLNPHRSDVSEQQLEIRKNLDTLFPIKGSAIPYGIDEDTALFIRDCNMARVSHRTDKNYQNYGYRGVYDLSVLPAAYAEIADRSETGHASPAELLFIDTELQIPAIELASLTVGYGQRMEQLEPMRQAVNNGVELFNGLNKRSSPSYQVKKASYEHGDEYCNVPPALLMTRTVNTGIILDSNIIVAERSSFVLRLDELDKYDLSMHKTIMKTHSASGKLTDIEDIPGFSELITELFNNNDYETLVPISVTAYAVNHDYEHLLHDDEFKRRRSMLIASEAYASYQEN